MILNDVLNVMNIEEFVILHITYALLQFSTRVFVRTLQTSDMIYYLGK